MSTNDKARLELHRRLEAVLGAEEASTLMSHILPFSPVTWDQVATKDDLRALEASLRSEISVSASGLRAEMADLRTELRTDMAELRTGLATLRADISDAITRQTRWMLGVAVALTSVMITVTQLAP